MLRIVLLLLVIVIPSGSYAERITIAADPWCPYNCEPKSQDEGFMVVLVKEILAKNNIEVDYISMPWARALKEAEKGNITGVVGALKTDAPGFIFPEYPQGVITDSFFTKAESRWIFNDVDSLSDKSLGIIEGYTYGKKLDEYIKANRYDYDRVQIAGGDDALGQNVAKMLSGKLDVVIEDRNVFNYYANKQNVSDKVRFAGVVPSDGKKSDHLYVAFSPAVTKSQEYANMISEGMKEMAKSGKLRSLIYKYRFQDWSKEVK